MHPSQDIHYAVADATSAPENSPWKTEAMDQASACLVTTGDDGEMEPYKRALMSGMV